MSDNVFHQHLDHCKQCREQPFNLCPIGLKTLNQAVQDSTPKMTFVDLINATTRPTR